ncbi:fasciclin domain-containing protein [Rhodocaloribacter litoris]|uniref:fasciclin domain-containing protein n=1 Tax=Rhodocaloribacter litoris TaxID=2558931 RepID=UPI00142294EE|nr:fasciclin domain-containing protein [Rhodocaloribacter litoris]QXD15580.1 fasciclin domain-containing protein [Rhodocaloribacter litoris]GIV60919.1 MAG: hypothetical protein KatS3mg043_2008 [Rhodothermaceae bacterium]
MKTHIIHHALRPAVLILMLALVTPLYLMAQERERTEDPSPAEQATLITTLEAEGSYTQFLALLRRAGLSNALNAEGPYTLFAPTDEALAEEDTDRFETMEPEALADFLRNYMVMEAVSLEKAKQLGALQTLNGNTLPVETAEDGTVTVAGAPVIAADVKAANGIIHGIGALITPSEKQER